MKKQKSDKTVKILLTLILIVTIFIFLKLIINPHYEEVFYWKKITMDSNSYVARQLGYNNDWGTNVIDFVCTPNVEYRDHKESGIYFEVTTGKGVGTCYLLKKDNKRKWI